MSYVPTLWTWKMLKKWNNRNNTVYSKGVSNSTSDSPFGPTIKSRTIDSNHHAGAEERTTGEKFVAERPPPVYGDHCLRQAAASGQLDAVINKISDAPTRDTDGPRREIAGDFGGKIRKITEKIWETPASLRRQSTSEEKTLPVAKDFVVFCNLSRHCL